MMEPLIDADRGDKVSIEYTDEGDFVGIGKGRVCEKTRNDDGDVVAVTITELRRDHVTDTVSVHEHFVTHGGAVEFRALESGPEWSYVGQLTEVEAAA